MQSSFLFASMPVCIAIGMFAAERCARMFGRVPTIILFKIVAVALLTLMALDTRLWAMPALIVPIYLVRTMMANCTRALARSILMDYVPKVCAHCRRHATCTEQRCTLCVCCIVYGVLQQKHACLARVQ